jgi:hypothetical protein
MWGSSTFLTAGAYRLGVGAEWEANAAPINYTGLSDCNVLGIPASWFFARGRIDSKKSSF